MLKAPNRGPHAGVWVCVCVCTHSVMSDSCNFMDGSLPGSSVHGLFQVRILEWVAISFSMEMYIFNKLH